LKTEVAKTKIKKTLRLADSPGVLGEQKKKSLLIHNSFPDLSWVEG
jgi:hypothetical protein